MLRKKTIVVKLTELHASVALEPVNKCSDVGESPIGNWQDRSRECKSNRFATMKTFGFYDPALPFQGSTCTNSLKPPLALLSSEFYSSRKKMVDGKALEDLE